MFSRRILQLLLCVLLSTLSTGCSVVRSPSGEEYAAIHAGEKVIVLLRGTGTLPDSTDFAVFSGWSTNDNVRIGLGSFETGGAVKEVEFPLHLSTEARNTGWVYFVLEPDVYYLAFEGTLRRQTSSSNILGEQKVFKGVNSVRWRINIPTGSRLVYAGTMHFGCLSRWYPFGHKYCDYIDGMVVENQETPAEKLAREYLPNLGPPQTVLIQRHEGETIILRTPGRKRSE